MKNDHIYQVKLHFWTIECSWKLERDKLFGCRFIRTLPQIRTQGGG